MTALAGRRRHRRRIVVAATIAILLIGLTVVGSFWQHSVREALRAEAQKLVTLGQMNLLGTTGSGSDATQAISYALASLELADTDQARLLALEALWRRPPPLVIPGSGLAVDFSRDGQQLAMGGTGPTIGIWGSKGGVPTVLKPKNPSKSKVSWIRFAAEPGLLFSSTGEPGHGAQMWSTADGRLLQNFECGGRGTRGRLSQDGRRLLTRTVSEDSSRITLRTWPLPEGDAIELGE